MAGDGKPQVVVTGFRVDWAEGRTAATGDLVPVGGGQQVKTVDGAPEIVEHPASEVWHVRLLSPDPMVPGRLVDATSYDDAVQAAVDYAGKLAKHADSLSAFAADLQEG